MKKITVKCITVSLNDSKMTLKWCARRMLISHIHFCLKLFSNQINSLKSSGSNSVIRIGDLPGGGRGWGWRVVIIVGTRKWDGDSDFQSVLRHM